MPAPVYIGDELTAAAFRLAGADVKTPLPDEAEQALREALRAAPLVLISAGVADQLPETVLRNALRSAEHLVTIVPDATGAEPPRLDEAIRRTLGIVA